MKFSPHGILQIARICHEVNRAYCQALGDLHQAPWALAPESQQQSIISGVRFHLDNPDASASATHANWLREKVASGWIWGHVKDTEKKEHPCILPFEMLPKEQQAKDYIFRAIVHELRNMAVRL